MLQVHVLVGAHGAGLTNSLFASPGGSLRGVLCTEPLARCTNPRMHSVLSAPLRDALKPLYRPCLTLWRYLGCSRLQVLQLMGSCFGTASFSYHAYEVLGRLTAGHAETLCCRCAQPERQKESDIKCDALAVARRVLAITNR